MKKIHYGDAGKKYTCFDCKYYYDYSHTVTFIKGYCMQLNEIMDFNQMTIEDKKDTCDIFCEADVFDGLGIA